MPETSPRRPLPVAARYYAVQDFLGCRYRSTLDDAWLRGENPPARGPRESYDYGRRGRAIAAAARLQQHLPTAPARGDHKVFSRVCLELDHDTRARRLELAPGAALPATATGGASDATTSDPDAGYLATLEALAAGHTIIENAVLQWREVRVVVAALVRQPEGGYVPLLSCTYSPKHPGKGEGLVLPSMRVGLGQPRPLAGKTRIRTEHRYRIAVALLALAELGLNSPAAPRWAAGYFPTEQGQARQVAGLLPPGSTPVDYSNSWALVSEPSGQLCQVVPAGTAIYSFLQAYHQPKQARPHRTKDCETCRYRPHCTTELAARDDLTQFLSGVEAKALAAENITTVTALATTGSGPLAARARAFRLGQAVLRRDGEFAPSQADIEVDIDTEFYLDSGAYLWGIAVNGQYRAFSVWDLPEPLGDSDPLAALTPTRLLATFARFWNYLASVVEYAETHHLSLRVYCYAKAAENRWLERSAAAYGGQHISLPQSLCPRYAPEEMAEQEVAEQAASEPPAAAAAALKYCELRAPEPAEIAQFLGSENWVDVYELVEAQLIGVHGLSLKKVAPAAGFSWRDNLAGEASLQAFEDAVGTDPALATQRRAELISYNRDDCLATRTVRHWLAAGAPGTSSESELLHLHRPSWQP